MVHQRDTRNHLNYFHTSSVSQPFFSVARPLEPSLHAIPERVNKLILLCLHARAPHPQPASTFHATNPF